MGSPFTHPILSPTAVSNLQTISEDAPSPLNITTPMGGQNDLRTTPRSTSTEVGDSLLRGYAAHIDHSHDISGIHPSASDPKTAPNIPSISSLDATENASLTSPQSTFSQPKSFFSHRKNARSFDSIPRQTIMKALASRPPNTTIPATPSLSGLLSISNNQDEKENNRRPTSSSSSQRLSAALSNLHLKSVPDRSPLTAKLPLQSPCFFHQRFDDAVDVDKVLDEIADDEWLSHSRLMQTATGVREVSKQLQRRPIKRAVKTIMIVTKAKDNRLVYLTRELAEWLLTTSRYGSDIGVTVYVDAKLKNSKRFNAPTLLEKDPRLAQYLRYWTPDLCWTSPEKFDLVLTLGGDGTVLFTSWLFQRIVPPVLSFSLGSLGFLTNFEFDKYQEHLDRVMGDTGMRVNLRMRFTCTVFRKDRSKGADPLSVEEGEQFEVLNELVIDRGPSPYVSNLELYGDNELLTIVQADGCIFSTPTGSTAYSLSAGGSLIHPSIPAILLTPICPHTLSFRPMVLSDTLSLKIAVPDNSRSTAYCAFDGKGRIELKQGDYVTLEASQYPFPTVMAGSNEWVESVQRALRWNVRGAVQKGWDADQAFGGEGDGEKEIWDIDTVEQAADGTDSGFGPSEDGGAVAGSPMRRQMSLLNM